MYVKLWLNEICSTGSNSSIQYTVLCHLVDFDFICSIAYRGPVFLTFLDLALEKAASLPQLKRLLRELRISG